MKRVSCSYARCGERRLHWAMPDVPRGTQEFEVPDDHPGPWYCSFTCAAMDGVPLFKKKKEADPS